MIQLAPMVLKILLIFCSLASITVYGDQVTDSKPHPPVKVKVAVLIENTPHLYHRDVSRGLAEINETLWTRMGVEIESTVDISFGVDPYKGRKKHSFCYH